MINFEVTPVRVRNAVKTATGREITGEQAKAVIDLFGEDLEALLMGTFTEFLKHHFPNQKGRK